MRSAVPQRIDLIASAPFPSGVFLCIGSIAFFTCEPPGFASHGIGPIGQFGIVHIENPSRPSKTAP